MRHVFLVVLMATMLLAVAACSGDDEGDLEADGASETAAASETPGDSTQTAAPTQDGDGAGEGASLELSGEVSGSFGVQGMSCDLLGGANNAMLVSISGTVGEEQYTIDVNAADGDTLGSVKLLASGNYGKWDNGTFEVRTDSGSLSVSADGGELDMDLAPAEVDPGVASEEIHIEGSWICP
jgi:hypothetical protein